MRNTIIILIAALSLGACAGLPTGANARLTVGKLIAGADAAVITAADAAKLAAPSLPVSTRQEAEDDLDNLNALLRNAHDFYTKGDFASASADIDSFNTGLGALNKLIGSH